MYCSPYLAPIFRPILLAGSSAATNRTAVSARAKEGRMYVSLEVLKLPGAPPITMASSASIPPSRAKSRGAMPVGTVSRGLLRPTAVGRSISRGNSDGSGF